MLIYAFNGQPRKRNTSVCIVQYKRSGSSVAICVYHLTPYFEKLKLYYIAKKKTCKFLSKQIKKFLYSSTGTLLSAIQFVLFLRISCFSWGNFPPPFIIDFLYFSLFRSRSEQIKIQLCLRSRSAPITSLFYFRVCPFYTVSWEEFKWKHP